MKLLENSMSRVKMIVKWLLGVIIKRIHCPKREMGSFIHAALRCKKFIVFVLVPLYTREVLQGKKGIRGVL